MGMVEESKREVSENYAFFQTQVDKLKKDHFKKYALLYKKNIINFFVSEDDAITIGMRDYGAGKFSVQQVGAKATDLGYQSHVIV